MCGDLVAFQSHNAYMCVCVLGVRERILPLLNSCFHEKKKKSAKRCTLRVCEQIGTANTPRSGSQKEGVAVIESEEMMSRQKQNVRGNEGDNGGQAHLSHPSFPFLTFPSFPLSM